MTAKLLQNFRNTKFLNEKSKNYFETRIFKEYNATNDSNKRRYLTLLAGVMNLNPPFEDKPILVQRGEITFGGKKYETLTPQEKSQFNFKIKLIKNEASIN